jgi:hypothetical protein
MSNKQTDEVEEDEENRYLTKEQLPDLGENIKLREMSELFGVLLPPYLTPKQYFIAKIVGIALAMVLGATGVVAGLVLLILSAIEFSVAGVVLSAFALAGGTAATLAGYIWFT